MRLVRSYNIAFRMRTDFRNNRNVFRAYQQRRPLGPRKCICYAPFNSIYFGAGGEAVACCLNRSHVVGKYPEHTLEEIWTGSEMKTLRAALRNNDLSMGCYHCKSRIESGNFDAVEARLYDKIPVAKTHPSMLVFELGNECNLECIMCSPEFSSSISLGRLGKNIIQSPYDDAFLKQLEDFLPKLHVAKFLGGEPFLMPVCYKIWERILEINPRCIIMVQSNGTILNERIRNLLSRGNFNVSVSIESFRPETYEKIRKNGDFGQVMKNIAFFSALATKNKFPFGISVCPMQQNREELPEIVRECNRRNAWIFFNTVWTPYDCTLYSLDHQQLHDLIRTLTSHDLPERTACEKHNKFHYECFINQLRAWQQEKRKKVDALAARAATIEQQRLKLESVPVDDLIEELLQHISPFLTGENIPEMRQVFLQKLQAVAHRMNDDKHLKLALQRIKEYPPPILLKELGHSDIDTLCAKAQDVIRDIASGASDF